MPLGFTSLSHGEIAFGFFNIETDLLLLDRYFFYADEFCRLMEELAQSADQGPATMAWSAYFIARGQDIGDLMGAIHGVRLAGFIGDVYKLFPFPLEEAGFKQKTHGRRTRPVIQPLLEKYAVKSEFPLKISPDQTVGLGPYVFTVDVFQQLINYVWLGGYPRWLDETRPDYVLAMRDRLVDSGHPLLEHIHFSD